MALKTIDLFDHTPGLEGTDLFPHLKVEGVPADYVTDLDAIKAFCIASGSRTLVASATALEVDNKGTIAFISGSVLELDLPNSLPDGWSVRVFKFGSGGRIDLTSSGGGSVVFDGLYASGSFVDILKSGSNFLVVGQYAPLLSPVEDVETGANRTISATDDLGKHLPFNVTSEVTIGDDLPPGFNCTLEMENTNTLTFVGSGTMTIRYYGQNTCTVAGTLVSIWVKSPTLCFVTIVEPV